jgi:hypothetical protein
VAANSTISTGAVLRWFEIQKRAPEVRRKSAEREPLASVARPARVARKGKTTDEGPQGSKIMSSPRETLAQSIATRSASGSREDVVCFSNSRKVPQRKNELRRN